MSIQSRVPASLAARVLRPIAAVGLILLASCGTRDEAPPDGPEWLTSRPAPVKLAIALDSGRAVSKLVTTRGGTLTATGADGARYRLSIPEGALLSDARITLIPVRAVDGLPLGGGSVAAVQLEPDGLRLMQPATLTIRTDAEVPAAERVAFGYRGAGDDAYRYPLEPDARRVEMKLFHFSGYGFGRAAPDDPGRLALQEARSYEARMSARIAAIFEASRTRTGDGADREAFTRVYELMGEYYDAILRPMMQRAESDDRLAECCIARYFGWERQVSLLGVARGDADAGSGEWPEARELRRRMDEGHASVLRIIRNAYDKGLERAIRACREEHDLGAVSTMLSLSRQAALLGLEGDEDWKRVAEEIYRCTTFEVEFESSFDNRGPAETRLFYHVRARVPVQLDLFRTGEFHDGNAAPLEYVRYDARGTPKEAIFGKDAGSAESALWEAVSSARVSPAGTRPGTFQVYGIEWDTNVIDVPGVDCDGRDMVEARNRATGAYITFAPGVPTEITRHTPNRDLLGAGPMDIDDTMWAIHWSNAHRREKIEAPGVGEPDSMIDEIYRVELTPGDEPGVWRASFRRPDPGTNGWSLAEDGFLVLRHTPR